VEVTEAVGYQCNQPILRWRAADVWNRYWQALLSLFAGLVVCELLLSPLPSVYQSYSSAIGIIGLSVEAILPIPQILSNARSRSCKGFRLSVLASWLLGDSMKMFWFFTSSTTIPWAFKICGMFQAACDSFLGIQYMMYGDGEKHSAPAWQHELQPNGFSTASGHGNPPGRRTSTTEKTT
jgi:solute carrier family 66, member 2